MAAGYVDVEDKLAFFVRSELLTLNDIIRLDKNLRTKTSLFGNDLSIGIFDKLLCSSNYCCPQMSHTLSFLESHPLVELLLKTGLVESVSSYQIYLKSPKAWAKKDYLDNIRGHHVIYNNLFFNNNLSIDTKISKQNFSKLILVDKSLVDSNLELIINKFLKRKLKDLNCRKHFIQIDENFSKFTVCIPVETENHSLSQKFFRIVILHCHDSLYEGIHINMNCINETRGYLTDDVRKNLLKTADFPKVLNTVKNNLTDFLEKNTK